MSDPNAYPQSYGHPPATDGPPVYGSAPVAQPAYGSAVVNPPGYPSAPGLAPPGSVPPGSVDTWGAYPPPPPPPKSRRTLWIVLAVVIALLAAAAIAAVVWIVPAVTGALNEQNATLSTPATLAGLTKSTDPKRQATAEDLKKQLAAQLPKSKGAIAAFYDDPADKTKLVMLWGVTAPISSPKKELDAAFDSSASSLSVTNVHKVDAGPLTGEAECGDGKTDELDLTLCGWADHGSLALAVFFNRDATSSAALFKQIRNGVLVRK
jgi:hypothetical protein